MKKRSEVSKTVLVSVVIPLAALFAVLFFGTTLAPVVRGFFADVFTAVLPDDYTGLSKQEMGERLQHAEMELSRIRYQALLYELLAKEHADLRAASAPVESFSKSVPARVIMRPPHSHYDTLVLDRGTESGISENDLVVFNGVVLGRIVSLGTSSSVAELFSAPEILRDVILGEPQAVAVARGLGGGAFEVLLPKDVAVSSGDIVKVSSSATLILGVVVSFSGDETDATKTVRFKSPVSVHELDFVSVVSAETP